ncbi:xaa-Pro aminopeptidase 1-like isoform X2 [Ruditapes philippinarum]|uniref:xaa-Pro aminopeptidase 1-like isoform X2 n=1 Tax=Ruditapes philippinarum TaxID=129788 RepID=UPI00295C1B9E|nr:xaa-Pro aminopeptidase 1-like isoform X2 [Ruditapes philippinarum]
MSVFEQLVIIAVCSMNRFTALQPGNWNTCENGEFVSTRTNTSSQVMALRTEMTLKKIGAYIVPSEDFHMSEFVSGYDQRRAFISGFDGSMGTAVITATHAALWTRGKYFLQAETQLGCDWILMREREPGVPTIEEWLGEQLKEQTLKKVGACPYFFGNSAWQQHSMALEQQGLRIEPVLPDLVDKIWTDDRPEFPDTVINPYPLKYAGKSWQDKVGEVRQEMEKRDADALIVTMLDETAWLFNMRATDIRGFVNDPFFYSLAIVRPNSISLYIKNKDIKLTAAPKDPESDVNMKEHLNTRADGSCPKTANKLCVTVKEYSYDTFIMELDALARNASVKRIWLSYFCNYAVYNMIDEDKIFVDNTPVAMLKTQKNDVEVQGMTNCHIRDAAALAIFASKLEKGVKAGEEWTELSASKELTRLRSLQDLNRGDSFASISSSGSNAAIIHYFPNNQTDRRITADETYLIDSGGQYLDGTTDVTRTFLWREPTSFEKECYTRVLMGQINLAMAIWTKGLFGREIDAWARQPLFDIGLTYKHGTGHGIGHYLSVHEGPGRISNYHAKFEWDVPLAEHMFYSDEPGYYEDGKFGIRLENIVYVKKVETKYSMKGVTMLGMETVTLFPYETHLIDYTIMSEKQISWLNDYNAMTLEKVGKLLKEQDAMDAYKWIEKRTKKVVISGAATLLVSNCILYSLMLVDLLW